MSRGGGAAAVALALAAIGCGKAADAPARVAAPAAPAALATVAGCTLDTPLKPGVPGSPGHYFESDINPNGHSELAWLMRRMQGELGQVRSQLLAGKTPTLGHYQHRIRCAWPTSASDRNPMVDGLAVNYLGAVDAFNAAPTRDRFDAVVDGCLSCHANTCAGPMVAIRPLRIAPGPEITPR